MQQKSKYVYSFRSLIILPMLLATAAVAQSPQGLPKPSDNDPIDLSSPFSIIFYIGIPVLAIVLYLVMRGRKKREK